MRTEREEGDGEIDTYIDRQDKHNYNRERERERERDREKRKEYNN